jgi:hypothetical protein
VVCLCGERLLYLVYRNSRGVPNQLPCPTHLQLGDLGLQLPHFRLLRAAQLAQKVCADLRLSLSDARLWERRQQQQE